MLLCHGILKLVLNVSCIYIFNVRRILRRIITLTVLSNFLQQSCALLICWCEHILLVLTSANSWGKNDHNFLNRQQCIELTLARGNAIYLFWYPSVRFLHKALRFSARNYVSCIYPPPQILQFPKKVLHFQQLIPTCTQLYNKHTSHHASLSEEF